MNRAEQIKLIQSAFATLPDMYDGFDTVDEKLYRMIEAGERKHREHKPDGCQCGITVAIASKFFTIKCLLNGFADPDKWTVDDILYIRHEALYAQAYAKRFKAQLAPWATKYTEPFKQIDYAELMKHDNG